MKFVPNQKVRISGHCGFRKGVTGTIDYPSKDLSSFLEMGSNYFRKIETPKGERTFVWIVFDEPQFDTDGDGPYSAAELLTVNIETVSDLNES